MARETDLDELAEERREKNGLPVKKFTIIQKLEGKLFYYEVTANASLINWDGNLLIAGDKDAGQGVAFMAEWTSVVAVVEGWGVVTEGATLMARTVAQA